MALTIDNPAILAEVRAALSTPGTREAWCVVNYVGPDTITCTEGGEGGLDDLRQRFEPSQIQYAIARATVMEKGTLKEVQRDFCIIWIGAAVSSDEKSKKAAHFKDAQAILAPFYGVAVTVHGTKTFNAGDLSYWANPNIASAHEIK